MGHSRIAQITDRTFTTKHTFEHIGQRVMLLNARKLLRRRKTKKELILLAIEDITTRKKYEKKIQALNKKISKTSNAKTEFITTASHELKTPITTILGFITTIHTIPLSDKEKSKYLKIIDSEGKRILALLDKLLDIGRIESEKIKLEYSLVDIPALVEHILTLYTIPPNLTINKKYHPKAVSCKADKIKVQQIIMNLFSNALHYAPPDGHITISSESTGAYILFCIEDDGPGIKKENLAKIFDMFYRDKAKKGSGLGLAIAKKLVKAHKGKIGAESNGIKGSKFFFTLPKNSARTSFGSNKCYQRKK